MRNAADILVIAVALTASPLNALLNTAAGATWVSIHYDGGGVDVGYSQPVYKLLQSYPFVLSSTA